MEDGQHEDDAPDPSGDPHPHDLSDLTNGHVLTISEDNEGEDSLIKCVSVKYLILVSKILLIS